MEKNKINNLNSYEVDIEKLSPGMKQYINIRRKTKPDIILLYRMGDFYETFFEDAITISRDLDIVLTSRDAGKIGKVPLAGIPVKSVDVYVAKLLEKGMSLKGRTPITASASPLINGSHTLSISSIAC